MLATLMIPFQVTLIPSYFIRKSFHMLDSYYPLIIPNFLGGAFGIFLMHQFIISLPKELYEAAVVDGYSPMGVFWKIYLPLCKPALSASLRSWARGITRSDRSSIYRTKNCIRCLSVCCIEERYGGQHVALDGQCRYRDRFRP